MTPENQLLQEGANEIKRLRRNNEMMHARLEMFDKCMLLFTSVPSYQSRGESEDVVWKMEQYIQNSNQMEQPTNIIANTKDSNMQEYKPLEAGTPVQ